MDASRRRLPNLANRLPFAHPVFAVTLAKSVKNAAELAGMREAHLRDGAALVRFLCWLEKTIASGKQCSGCCLLPG